MSNSNRIEIVNKLNLMLINILEQQVENFQLIEHKNKGIIISEMSAAKEILINAQNELEEE